MAELVRTMTAVDGGVVLTAIGDLDYVACRRFADHLSQARELSQVLVLDMTGVDVIDTSCLAAIATCWQEHARSGGELALAGARYAYTRALWLTGLADKLPMYDDVQAALTAGRASRGSSAQ